MSYHIGLGANIDVTALAAAMDAGQIHGTYPKTFTWYPHYLTNGQSETDGNDGLYVDEGTAGTICGLLGASVVDAIPIDLNGTGIPLAPFCQFSDGSMVNAATISEVADTGYPPFAPRIQQAVQNQVSSPSDTWNVSQAATPPTIVSTTTPPVVGTTPVVAAPPVQIPTPVLSVTPVTLPPTVNSGGTGTGSSTTPVVNSGGAVPTAPTTGSSVPETTDWTAWFTQTSIGSIPNWALVAGAAVLFFGFSGGRR